MKRACYAISIALISSAMLAGLEFPNQKTDDVEMAQAAKADGYGAIAEEKPAEQKAAVAVQGGANDVKCSPRVTRALYFSVAAAVTLTGIALLPILCPRQKGPGSRPDGGRGGSPR